MKTKLIAVALTMVMAITTCSVSVGCDKSDVTVSTVDTVIADTFDIKDQVTAKPETAAKTFELSGGVDGFVTRLYALCLGREPDAEGFEFWTSRLESGEISARECAYGFFFSPEFTELANSITDESYIELFYNVFLGRESDPVGKANWLAVIAETPYDTTVLFPGFVDSQEFRNIVESFDLVLGDPFDLPNVERNVGANPVAMAPYAGITPSGGAGGAGAPAAGGGAPAPSGGGSSAAPTGTTVPTGGSTGSTTPTGTTPTGTTPTGTTPTGTTPTSTTPTDTTPSVTTNYDPDNHGGYWITGSNGSYDQYGYQYNGNGVKVNATQFNNYVNSGESYRLAYVCSSGYVISYANYQDMNWSVVNDPHFGGRSATTGVYQGAYWMQGVGNNDTEWIAAWLYGTDAAWDAFDNDTHKSQPVVVGLNETVTGQTFMYCEWDGSSVYADYDRWANAMSAYSYSNARHSSDVCAQYGVSNETLGDYIMIEWCLGNLDYNLQTLPLPNYVAYTGMGSNNYANYFTTSVSRNTNTYFPVSRDWNYSDRGANTVNVAVTADYIGTDGSTTDETQPVAPAPATTETQPASAPEETTPTTSGNELNSAQQQEIAYWESLGFIYGVDFTVDQNGNATFYG